MDDRLTHDVFLSHSKEPAHLPEQAEPLAVLEHKLTKHQHRVNSVAVSPDGTWAVSGSSDGTVKIWNLKSGLCRATLLGHGGIVKSVAIIPDGTRILSVSGDYSLQLWDVKTGNMLSHWSPRRHAVHTVCALADSTRALSAGNDDTLRLWNISTGECTATLKTGALYSGAVSPDGKCAVAGCQSWIELWDLTAAKQVARLDGHSGIVRSVQIAADGRFAVSSSEDKTVKIWDLKARRCVGTLEGRQNNEDSVAISPSGDLIASTGFVDQTVRLWDRKSGVCVQTIYEKGHFKPISVTFSPDGSRLVVGAAAPPKIYVYRLTGVRAAQPAEATRRYVNAKVVLIGEGTVGKTSLAHRLIEDRYVVRDRTHGMNVWPLNLPLSSDAILEREALLWDLAGQEDYRLIHRLFLEETALALLLINPQKDDPFAEAGDWLKSLETASSAPERRVPRLLVFSQIDVGGMKIGNSKIEQFREQHGFVGWLATSAKTGETARTRRTVANPRS